MASDEEVAVWYESGMDQGRPLDERSPLFDPVAKYDGLGRKQLKQTGFLEVVRGLPWLMRENFTVLVPDEMVATVADGEVEVPCSCKSTTVIERNVATPCSGDCGRWFWEIAGKVRVGYDPERHAHPNP